MSTRPHSAAARVARLRVLATGIVLLAGCLAAAPLAAKTLRFASAFDPQSLDPHALALLYQTRVVSQIYESLVSRDRNFAIEPALATSWQQVDPKRWRFKLRPNVKFHDGAPFTADDVVFSITRALAKNSQRAFQLRGVLEARKVDPLTVDVILEAPDAVLPEKLIYVGIMNKAWSAAHDVVEPQNYNAKQETYAVRHTNGTGPYALKSYESDVRCELVANPHWWGRRGNVDEATYVVIQSDATRLAALISGQVDLVIDPPFQDVPRLQKEARFKLAQITDIGTQYLGFDQSRDELQFGDVKGRNPFKDRRVRLALYQAIDTDAINRVVMRGLAVPAGLILPNPEAAGVPAALNKRFAYDVAAAKRLLAEAGYPHGFSTVIDCQNVRESVCTAIAGMLARIGVNVRVNSLQNARYFAKGQARDTSFYLLGWGGPNTDAIFTLQPLLHGRNEKGDGDYNWGDYRDAKMDALIDQAKVEMDGAKRQALIDEALKMVRDNVYLIPIHRRMAPLASRANVQVVVRPDSWVEVSWVNLK